MKYPFYSGLAFLLIYTILWVLPSSLAPLIIIVAFMGLLPIAGLLGITTWHATVALFRYRWRRALSMSAFPLMVIVTIPATDAARFVRDDLRFSIHKSRYLAEVAEAKRKGKHFAFLDDWSIFFNANSFVVWDKADKPEELLRGFTVSANFGDHYYLIGD